jgi:hypothetical protein
MEREKQRDRERQIERERDRETETDRQTDRQILMYAYHRHIFDTNATLPR